MRAYPVIADPLWLRSFKETTRAEVYISSTGNLILLYEDSCLHMISNNGTEIWQISSVSDFAFSRNFEKIALVRSEDEIEIINSSGIVLNLIKTPSPYKVGISADGSTLVAASTNGSIYVYEFNATGILSECYSMLSGHYIWEVSSVSLSNDGKYVAIGTQWGNLILLDRIKKRSIEYWAKRNCPITPFLSPDGSYLVVLERYSLNDFLLLVFNQELQILLHKWLWVAAENPISMSPEFNYIALTDFSYGIELITITGYRIMSRWFPARSHPFEFETVSSISVSKNAQYLAVGTLNGTIYLLNQNGTLLWRYYVKEPIVSVAISESGDYLVAVTSHSHLLFMRGSYLFVIPEHPKKRNPSISFRQIICKGNGWR